MYGPFALEMKDRVRMAGWLDCVCYLAMEKRWMRTMKTDGAPVEIAGAEYACLRVLVCSRERWRWVKWPSVDL